MRHHDRAAGRQGRHQRDVDGIDVVKRQHAQANVALGQFVSEYRVERRGNELPLRVQRALGLAGASGSIHKERRLIRSHRRHITIAAARIAPIRPTIHVGRDHAQLTRYVATNFVERRAMPIRNEHDTRVAVIERIPKVCTSPTDIERHRHEPTVNRSEEQLGREQPVVHQERDLIAPGQP